MKLTRILSLVLALVLAVSLFGSVVVSAADTAELKFVVKDGDNVVSGELEKDKVYTLEIVLDNISTGKVSGVEFKLAYNKDVMKFVDASGADVSGAAAFTTTVSGGLVPFGTPVAADGVIAYTVAPDVAGNASLALDIKNNGLEVGSSFVVTKMNFKAVADGKLGLVLHEDNKLNVAIPAKAEVTVIPSTERVGKIAYVSATADAEFAAAKTYVVGKTEADAIIADLAKDYASVKVTYVDEEQGTLEKEAAIVWAADKAFDAEKAGEYKFVGTVTTPEGVNYTGDAVTVEATITLDTLKVQEVEAIADITVRVGDAVTLPAVVNATVTGGEVVELPVTWTPAEVVTTEAGTFDFVGAVAGTDNIDANEKTAAVKVIVLAASEDKAPTAVDAVEVNAAIDADDIEADALAALPEFVTVGTDAKAFINVTWEQVTEAPEAGFALGDVIEFKPVADDVTFPADFTAKVTVAVPAGKVSFSFDYVETTIEKKTDDGYTLEDAVEDAAFAGQYEDGTAIDLSTIVWDFEGAAFDGETAGEYELVGTWADIYGHEAEFKVTIVIKNAGATGIAIYNSVSAANPLTSLVLDAGDSKKIYAKLEPIGVEDTVTWSASKNYVTLTPSDDTLSVTIRAKSAGTLDITATTSTGATATLKVLVNASYNGGSSSTGPSAYNNNPAIGQLLSNAADAMEQQKVAEASAFSDLGGYEWAATQIETLRLLSIVSGKTNTTFAPADSVTRAEYLAMLVRLFGFQANGEVKSFTDVPADAWYYNTVSIASSLGIAYGYENGAFDPNAVISRQDMAVFAERAINAAGITPVRGIERAFNDNALVSDYAKMAVSNMSAYGIINGMNDGNFCPADTANRAQAAVVVYNLYVAKNK